MESIVVGCRSGVIVHSRKKSGWMKRTSGVSIVRARWQNNASKVAEVMTANQLELETPTKATNASEICASIMRSIRAADEHSAKRIVFHVVTNASDERASRTFRDVTAHCAARRSNHL